MIDCDVEWQCLFFYPRSKHFLSSPKDVLWPEKSHNSSLIHAGFKFHLAFPPRRDVKLSKCLVISSKSDIFYDLVLIWSACWLLKQKHMLRFVWFWNATGNASDTLGFYHKREEKCWGSVLVFNYSLVIGDWCWIWNMLLNSMQYVL